MPFDVRTDPATGLLSISVSGTVSRCELERMFDEIERIEDSQPVSPSRIADFRGVERFDADFAQVFPLADRRKKRQHRSSHRTAIVVEKPLHVGFIRLYQTLNDNPRTKIEVFSDRERALGWLAVSVPVA